MSKVLVIGCGGVASVAISKCCQVSDVFTELCIASRTKSKCDALAAKLAPNHQNQKSPPPRWIADDVQQLCDLINSYKPDLVMNIALPYQDLTIMDACLPAASTIWTPPTMSRKIPMTRNGALSMKSAARKQASPPTLITAGSGYKKKFEDAGLTACWAAALTRALPRLTALTPPSMSLTPSTPSISWTATAATMAMPSPPTLTPKSTCAKFLPPAAIWKTASGSRSRHEHQAGI